MIKKPVVSVSLDPVVHLLDTLPDVTLPDVSIGDLDAPDLSVVADVVVDASVLAADTAAVIGRRGSRLAARTASSAWRNRQTVARVAVVAVIVVAIASLAKRSRDTENDER